MIRTPVLLRGPDHTRSMPGRWVLRARTGW